MDDYPEILQRSEGQPARRAETLSNETDSEIDLDLRGLISQLWREKLLIASFGLLFALVAVAGVYSVTPLYKSSSVVMLDQTEERIIDVESVVSGLTPDYYTIRAESEVLSSRALAGRVVDAADLTQHPLFNPMLAEEPDPSLVFSLASETIEFIKNIIREVVTDREKVDISEIDEQEWSRNAAIDRLLRRLEVAAVSETYVYSITIETPDPVLSADLANKFANLYILDQLEAKFEATQAATEWLAGRVAELKSDLEASEAEVEAYNSSIKLVSEESLAGMNRQIKDLRERREGLVRMMEERRERAAQLKIAVNRQDYAAVAELVEAPELEDIAAELAALINGQEASERLLDRFNALVNRTIQRTEAEAVRASDQLAALESTINELETRLERQTQDLVELRQLQREAEANRRIYEQFLRRLNETSVQQGVQRADARVLSEAVVDFNASYPKKTITVLLAGFLGGIVGLLVVVLREQMARTFRSTEQLEERTGLPVLGAIPSAPMRMRRGLLEYAVERPSSALVEAIRNLRTGVLMANIDRTPQVIMLTSSLPKEGKTTCSLLLAQNAAGLGKKVLLIECDLRRRTFRTYFNDAPDYGLMSVLAENKPLDEAVHHDARTGLDVILGEESKINAADVFASQKFRAFVDEARKRYNFVVIDTPPVLAVSDARLIAPLTDAIVYCVRWNSTHRDQVRSGINQFAQIGLNITGLALTQIDTRKMAKYGYGGYNYYYYKTAKSYYHN